LLRQVGGPLTGAGAIKSGVDRSVELAQLGLNFVKNKFANCQIKFRFLMWGLLGGRETWPKGCHERIIWQLSTVQPIDYL
jgi:hypothetical protein